VLWFSLQLLSETSLTLRRIQRNITCYSCQILIKLDFFLDRFSKNTQISNCLKILPVGAELFHTDRLTHTTKLFLFAILRTRLKMTLQFLLYLEQSNWSEVHVGLYYAHRHQIKHSLKLHVTAFSFSQPYLHRSTILSHSNTWAGNKPAITLYSPRLLSLQHVSAEMAIIRDHYNTVRRSQYYTS